MSMKLRLVALFGPHCTDVSAVESVRIADHIEGDAVPGGVLAVSFTGVHSLSPSCASALLLALGQLKSELGVRVRFVDLARKHARQLQASIASLQQDARATE